ncbi:MAG: low molecular weight phosphatase family protein [Candidatus Micrarchaeota archaeon]|nr:low molecular weight phosphatase family protein [Candidatus Micrarchaeota archaeon]
MRVLFVCRGNVGRSQMAEAFFNRMSKKNTGYSAGTSSRDEGVEGAVIGNGKWMTPDAMKEIGYDIYGNVSKQLSKPMVDQADKVVVIMRKEEGEMLMPDYLKKSGKVEMWEILDPKYKGMEVIRSVRDEIKMRVEKLVREIG